MRLKDARVLKSKRTLHARFDESERAFNQAASADANNSDTKMALKERSDARTCEQVHQWQNFGNVTGQRAV
jgi:hypothetical protein